MSECCRRWIPKNVVLRKKEEKCPAWERTDVMVKIEVPYIDQSVRYPTGCESVSAVMLLQHLGYRLGVDEFIEGYLRQVPFERRDGELWGADPRKDFCGSPYEEDGFGCYAPVIARALERVFSEETPAVPENLPPDVKPECMRRHGPEGIQAEKSLRQDGQQPEKHSREECRGARTIQIPDENAGKYRAVDETGAPMEVLLREYIDRGMPVIFWACINMRAPIRGPQWRLYGSGETFTWISNEHCMLLVGYDEEGYYFNDPYGNNGVVRYPRGLTEERHAAQYKMAVGVQRRIKYPHARGAWHHH